MAGGLAGLVKTAALEWEHTVCRVVDLSPDVEDLDRTAPLVVREMLNANPGGAKEVGLTPSDRFELDLVSADYPEGDLPLEPGQTVVVTGGARGSPRRRPAPWRKRLVPCWCCWGAPPCRSPFPSG